MGKNSSPTYKEFGKGLLASFEEHTDSLDQVQIMLANDNFRDDEPNPMDEKDRVLALPKRQRRMELLRMALKGNVAVTATIFGITVEITPQPAEPDTGPGPDLSGDREPRNPLAPTDSASAEVATP